MHLENVDSMNQMKSVLEGGWRKDAFVQRFIGRVGAASVWATGMCARYVVKCTHMGTQAVFRVAGKLGGFICAFERFGLESLQLRLLFGPPRLPIVSAKVAELGRDICGAIDHTDRVIQVCVLLACHMLERPADHAFIAPAVVHVLSEPAGTLALLEGSAVELDASRAALIVRELEVNALARSLAKVTLELESLKRVVENSLLHEEDPTENSQEGRERAGLAALKHSEVLAIQAQVRRLESEQAQLRASMGARGAAMAAAASMGSLQASVGSEEADGGGEDAGQLPRRVRCSEPGSAFRPQATLHEAEGH